MHHKIQDADFEVSQMNHIFRQTFEKQSNVGVWLQVAAIVSYNLMKMDAITI